MTLSIIVGRTRLHHVAVAATMLLASCGTERALAPKLGSIAVSEFEANDTVTAVSAYESPLHELGIQLASRTTDELRERGRDAVVVPSGQSVQADLIVSGRITRVDGGSRGLRILMSQTLGFGFTDYGVGGGFLRAEGQVARKDGTILGTFTSDHTEKSTGYFWARFGGSPERQIAGCIDEIGEDIAATVAEGRYIRTAESPVIQTRIPSPLRAEAGTSATTDRFRDLESLHERGLLTDEEYRDKRRRIIEEL